MTLKKTALALCCAAAALLFSSHIGSPGIVFNGTAGPYEVLVNILPPEVVPGTAQVYVRVKDKDVSSVKLQAVYFRYGSDKAPDPESALPVAGSEGMFGGMLWLMSHGSSSVKIMLDGEKGTGATVIPVPALATAQLQMENSLSSVLMFLGAVLFFGMATIVAASVGEAVLPPGEKLGKKRKIKAALTGLGTALFLVWLLYFGYGWWQAEERSYQRYMYKPVGLAAQTGNDEGDGRTLALTLDDKGHFDRRPGDLVPDHGKFMHLFMVGPDLSAFAHLHPQRLDSLNFSAMLPAGLPGGEYRLFADIVHESGLGETLTAQVTLPEAGARAASLESPGDPDDSWAVFASPFGESQKTASGAAVRWIKPQSPLKAGLVEQLVFEAERADGLPEVLQPLLGMLGHAVVLKHDGSVFIHLHPIGTMSMAAQEAISGKISGDVTLCSPLDSLLGAAGLDPLLMVGGDSVSTMRTDALRLMKDNGLTNTVSFPYAFPSAGRYRLWVQLRLNGQIETAAFDLDVEEGPGILAMQ